MKRRQDWHRPQYGLTTVEFAIVATVLFVVLFAVIEFSRALYVVNMLTEATRRGARMAAVCPVGDTDPASVAAFTSGGSNSSLISGLSTANVSIQYLDVNGAVLTDPTGDFDAIRYVRASIVGFSLPLMIPFLYPTLTLDGFATTLPRESLGIPRSGTIQPC